MDVLRWPTPKVSYSLSPREGEGRETVLQLDRSQLIAPAGQNLVRIGLMAYIPHQSICRRVEHIVISAVSRPAAKCPPIWLTVSIRHCRSSVATSFNWVAGRARRSAGEFGATAARVSSCREVYRSRFQCRLSTTQSDSEARGAAADPRICRPDRAHARAGMRAFAGGQRKPDHAGVSRFAVFLFCPGGLAQQLRVTFSRSSWIWKASPMSRCILIRGPPVTLRVRFAEQQAAIRTLARISAPYCVHASPGSLPWTTFSPGLRGLSPDRRPCRFAGGQQLNQPQAHRRII